MPKICLEDVQFGTVLTAEAHGYCFLAPDTRGPNDPHVFLHYKEMCVVAKKQNWPQFLKRVSRRVGVDDRVAFVLGIREEGPYAVHWCLEDQYNALIAKSTGIYRVMGRVTGGKRPDSSGVVWSTGSIVTSAQEFPRTGMISLLETIVIGDETSTRWFEQFVDNEWIRIDDPRQVVGTNKCRQLARRMDTQRRKMLSR